MAQGWEGTAKLTQIVGEPGMLGLQGVVNLFCGTPRRVEEALHVRSLDLTQR